MSLRRSSVVSRQSVRHSRRGSMSISSSGSTLGECLPSYLGLPKEECAKSKTLRDAAKAKHAAAVREGRKGDAATLWEEYSRLAMYVRVMERMQRIGVQDLARRHSHELRLDPELDFEPAALGWDASRLQFALHHMEQVGERSPGAWEQGKSETLLVTGDEESGKTAFLRLLTGGLHQASRYGYFPRCPQGRGDAVFMSYSECMQVFPVEEGDEERLFAAQLLHCCGISAEVAELVRSLDDAVCLLRLALELPASAPLTLCVDDLHLTEGVGGGHPDPVGATVGVLKAFQDMSLRKGADLRPPVFFVFSCPSEFVPAFDTNGRVSRSILLPALAPESPGHDSSVCSFDIEIVREKGASFRDQQYSGVM